MSQPGLMVVPSRRIHYVGRVGRFMGQDEPAYPPDEAVPPSPFPAERTFKILPLEPVIPPLQTQAARAAAEELKKKAWTDIDQMISDSERPVVTHAEAVFIVGGSLAFIAGLLTGGDKGGILALVGLTSASAAGVSAAFVR